MSQGLFDLQVNGFAGVDFQQADLSENQLAKAVNALLRHGTDRILLTLITDRISSLAAKLERIEKFRAANQTIRKVIVGYHIEGPYLSEKNGYRGAHQAEIMKDPDTHELDLLQRAAGHNIRLVTIAPERQGSPEFIRHAVGTGVRISLGHTDADPTAIDHAIRAGATLCTHLGNGCPSEMQRHDNIVQRLLCRDELTACFIPDGIHVPFFALKNYLRVKPRDKVLFTTDCMAAAGAPAGRYQIAHHTVEVGKDRIVREPGKTNFAGSALSPDEGILNLQKELAYTEAEARAKFGSEVAKALVL
ncbi:MAG: N-acetylglucosamine-6-phosphate deacetylase [Chthoniobacterales bacterium]